MLFQPNDHENKLSLFSDERCNFTVTYAAKTLLRDVEQHPEALLDLVA